MHALAIAYGQWLFKYRNRLFTAVLLALLVGFPPHPALGAPASDAWFDLLGLLVAGAGQALRAMVIGLEYIKRGGMNKKIYADNLVTGGMFSHCRNPLYVGNLLILAGLFVFQFNPWSALVGGVFFLTAYHSIVAAEESYLGDRFGEAYAAYCRDVNRWVPRLAGLRGTLHSMRFNWRRVVAKDYGTAFYWLLGILVLRALEQLRFDHDHSAAAYAPYGAALALLAAGAFAVRRMKKRGLAA